jgi:molybdopterin-guanine dinucleotide biosynthesis protein A
MENLEIIVIAGGEGLRFQSDTPKHLVEITGEPLVRVTAKRLLKYTNKLKIIIPPDAEIYKRLLGSEFQLVPRVGSVKPGTGKCIEAIKASSENKNLLFIYGDCYLTYDALEKIFQKISLGRGEDILFFCRHGSEAFVNKGGGEIFGVYLDKNFRNEFVKAAIKTQELFDSKKIWRDTTWEIAKTLKNHTIENEYYEHPNFDFYFEINDLTDDIDVIEEYDNLLTLLPNTFKESIMLLEKIYKSFNNIAQKYEININSYFCNSSHKKLILSEILELEFYKLKEENTNLQKQVLDVVNSKSFRYTLMLRKITLYLKSEKMIKNSNSNYLK